MQCLRSIRSAGLLLTLFTHTQLAAWGQTKPQDGLRWSFSSSEGATPIDGVRHTKANLSGNFLYVPGVHGEALRLDGYTTGMSAAASDLPDVTHGFTASVWVGLNTYPWNEVPLIASESQHQAGFELGIDAFGHAVFGASINGQWKTITGKQPLALKRWAHVAAVYTTQHSLGSLDLYIDGKSVGTLPVEGEFSPSTSGLLIGRVAKPTLPFPEAEVKPKQPVLYSLDGLLDEVTLLAESRSPSQIARDFAAVPTPQSDALRWQRMPSGPPGPGTFGAYYASLKYEDAWDRLRQIGPSADVVVRFDNSPNRLVFWQGLNYVPAWVTGDDKWYTDEFLEVWNHGCPDGGDCEPMSDKVERFSHVDILESNPVRAVVHWRYALIEAVGYKPAWEDPLTHQSDWADEYWTVYPDGVAIRKQVLHSSHTQDVHEWHETIVLHQPGTRPEDNIHADAITLSNMQGVSKTYTWRPNPAGSFLNPQGPADSSTPASANIQMVNLKSAWKPFQIVSPDGVSSDFYNNEKSFFLFECWNHWPVAQIASSDRPCVAADRPSHSSLSHLFWKTYKEENDTATKLLMDGLTTTSIQSLLPLAKSWLSPPALHASGKAVRSQRYDPEQRAYVIEMSGRAEGPVRLTFDASPASPLFHPAILVHDWRTAPPRLILGTQATLHPNSIRMTQVPRLEGSDLLIWLDLEATKQFELTLQPNAKAAR